LQSKTAFQKIRLPFFSRWALTPVTRRGSGTLSAVAGSPKSKKVLDILCYWAANDLKMTGAAVGRRLKMSKSAVSRAAVRGERIASEMKLKLFKE
jgi:hypothetical protein